MAAEASSDDIKAQGLPQGHSALAALLNGKAPVTVLGAVLGFVLLYLTPMLTGRFDGIDQRVSGLDSKVATIATAIEGRLLRLELIDQNAQASKLRWDKLCEEAKNMEITIVDIRRRLERLEKP